MKNLLNYFAAFAVLTLTAFTLFACSDNEQATEPDVDAAEPITVNNVGISQYNVILRGDYSGDGALEASQRLAEFFDELGVEASMKTDWTEVYSGQEYEIIIGEADREEYGQFRSSLTDADQNPAWGVTDGKLVFCAPDESGLVDSVECFIEYFAECVGDTADGSDTANGSDAGNSLALTDGFKYEFTCSDRLLLKDGGTTMSELKDTILWGVNGHNHYHLPYTEENTDEIIRLAAELGSKIYRINYNPTNETMLAYIKNVAELCHGYGMKVMLVMDNMSGTVDEIVARMEYMAANLDGIIDYFQIFNETDIYCSKNDDGSFYNITDWTGMSEGYYNPTRVAECVEKMAAATETFRRVAPDAKLVINIGSRHYPMLDWYVEAGIDWDIIAYDIYDLDLWNHADFFAEMEERYGKPYMVAECNYPANSGKYVESEQANWLRLFIEQMNNVNSDKLLAVIIYELMDESTIQEGDEWNGEAHFGIVNTVAGKPGEPKEAYRTVQKLLCGGEAEIKRIYEKID